MPIPSHLSLAIPDSDLPRVVIVGGGFGGLNLAKGLKKAKAQVVLLDKNNFHTFQPLLYQVATAGLEPDSIAGPLRKTFDGDANYFFRMVKVTGVNASENEIETSVGNLRYDYLVLANGSVTNYFNKKDFRPKVLPLKRIVHALDLRSHIFQNFEQAVMTKDQHELDKMMNVVVVGGGPTGVEVSGAIAELKKFILPKDYPDLDFSQMKIHLIEGSDRLLNGMSGKAGSEALRYIKKLGINVQLKTTVEDYDGDTVQLSSGKIDTATVIWSAGVRGNVVEGLGEHAVEKSRILVDQFSRVQGTENVFAIGDVA
ncbi:MAG: FAD-dependent oxidoreductase, partial [Bacteroidota bacterium]